MGSKIIIFGGRENFNALLEKSNPTPGLAAETTVFAGTLRSDEWVNKAFTASKEWDLLKTGVRYVQMVPYIQDGMPDDTNQKDALTSYTSSHWEIAGTIAAVTVTPFLHGWNKALKDNQAEQAYRDNTTSWDDIYKRPELFKTDAVTSNESEPSQLRDKKETWRTIPQEHLPPALKEKYKTVEILQIAGAPPEKEGQPPKNCYALRFIKYAPGEIKTSEEQQRRLEYSAKSKFDVAAKKVKLAETALLLPGNLFGWLISSMTVALFTGKRDGTITQESPAWLKWLGLTPFALTILLSIAIPLLPVLFWLAEKLLNKWDREEPPQINTTEYTVRHAIWKLCFAPLFTSPTANLLFHLVTLGSVLVLRYAVGFVFVAIGLGYSKVKKLFSFNKNLPETPPEGYQALPGEPKKQKTERSPTALEKFFSSNKSQPAPPSGYQALPEEPLPEDENIVATETDDTTAAEMEFDAILLRENLLLDQRLESTSKNYTEQLADILGKLDKTELPKSQIPPITAKDALTQDEENGILDQLGITHLKTSWRKAGVLIFLTAFFASISIFNTTQFGTVYYETAWNIFANGFSLAARFIVGVVLCALVVPVFAWAAYKETLRVRANNKAYNELFDPSYKLEETNTGKEDLREETRNKVSELCIKISQLKTIRQNVEKKLSDINAAIIKTNQQRYDSYYKETPWRAWLCSIGIADFPEESKPIEQVTLPEKLAEYLERWAPLPKASISSRIKNSFHTFATETRELPGKMFANWLDGVTITYHLLAKRLGLPKLFSMPLTMIAFAAVILPYSLLKHLVARPLNYLLPSFRQFIDLVATWTSMLVPMRALFIKGFAYVFFTAIGAAAIATLGATGVLAVMLCGAFLLAVAKLTFHHFKREKECEQAKEILLAPDSALKEIAQGIELANQVCKGQENAVSATIQKPITSLSDKALSTTKGLKQTVDESFAFGRDSKCSSNPSPNPSYRESSTGSLLPENSTHSIPDSSDDENNSDTENEASYFPNISNFSCGFLPKPKKPISDVADPHEFQSSLHPKK